MDIRELWKGFVYVRVGSVVSGRGRGPGLVVDKRGFVGCASWWVWVCVSV